jgi:hypothetical protein
MPAQFETNATITSTGAVALSGTSSSYAGLLLSGGNALIASSGNLTANGTSSTDAGLQLRGTDTLTNSGAGLLSLDGNSTPYRGAEIFANANVTISGNTSISGTSTTGLGIDFSTVSTTSISSGNLTVAGLSTSASGTAGTLRTLFGEASLTNSGSRVVNMTCTSQDAGAANGGSAGVIFLGTNTLTNSGSGSLSVNGTNAALRSRVLQPWQCRATMSVAGTSNSGYGFYLGGSNTLTASSGNLTLSGSSTVNLGMEVLGTSSITNNGSGTLALNASGDAALQASLSSSNGTLTLCWHPAKRIHELLPWNWRPRTSLTLLEPNRPYAQSDLTSGRRRMRTLILGVA